MKNFFKLSFALLLCATISTPVLAQQGMGVGNNNPQEMLDVSGAIRIGTDNNNSNAAPTGGSGTIRFRAGTFQGWDGTSWVPLGGGGGTDDQNLTSAVLTGSNLQINIEDGNSTTVDLSGLVNDADADVTNELQDLSSTTSGTNRTINISSGTGTTISVADNDNDAANEIQSLSLSGNTLSISGSNNVNLAGFVNSDEQDLSSTTSGTNRTINITGGTGTTISVADNDNNSSNELQTLSISGSDISLSNGGGTVSVPNDADWTISGNDQYSAVSGNVGVGTTNPTNKLTIGGSNSDSAPILSLQSGNDAGVFNNGAQIAFGYNGTPSYQHFIHTRHNSSAANNAIDFYLSDGTQNNSITTGSTHTMSLVSGNVGVGTTSPSEKLHVAGSSLVSANGSSTSGIEQIPMNSTTNSGGRVFFREDNNSDNFGFSMGYTGFNGSNGILNWGPNSFNISRHNGNATGEVVMSVWRGSGNVGIGGSSANEQLEVAGKIRMVDGNQAAGYIPVSDANGSMTWTDPTTVSAASGVEIVDADGDTKIQVEESSDEDFIRFDTDGAERMVIENNGNIGMGQTNPAWPVTVRHDANVFSATDVIDPLNFAMNVVKGTTGNNEGVGIGLGSSGGGSQAGAGIVFKKTNNNSLGDLMLTIKSNGSTNGPQMPALTIKPFTGYVGIGTTSPNRKLHLQDGAATWMQMTNTASGTAAGDGIIIGLTSTNEGEVRVRENWPLAFRTDDTERMRISPDGNVGVGTTSPSEKLHVAGSTLNSSNATSNSGVEVIPMTSATNSGGRVFFREDNANDNFGFSMGYTGLNAPNGILNWGANSFNISRHNGNATGEVVMSVSRGSGNVGIGGSSANEKLEVAGKIRMVDGNQTAGYIPVSDANGSMTWTDPTNITDGDWTINGNNQYSAVSGNVGIGNNNPGSKLHITSNVTDNTGGLRLSSPSSNSVIYQNSGNDLVVGKFSQPNQLVMDTGGNVGVGTDAPSEKLHVAGSTLSSSNASSNSGVEVIPMTSATNSGGRVFFREDNNSDNFGFSMGYTGNNGINGILNWGPNSFNISRHNGNATGEVVMSVSRGSGNVGIGNEAPDSRLHILDNVNVNTEFVAIIENSSNSASSNGLKIQAGQNTQSTNNRFISFQRPDGQEIGAVRQINSNFVDFWSPSDQRLKTNVQNTEMGLDELMLLEVKDYVYKDDLDQQQTGFLAQQVNEIFPNAVSVGGDDVKTDPWMMNYGRLTPLLVKAVQDLKSEKDQLQQQVQALLQRVEQLEQQ